MPQPYYLLVTDLHLDDNPDNEYRWQVFEHIHQAMLQYVVACVFILGDAWDRKDRHSAVLVNRTVEMFKQIMARTGLIVLKGNHDRPQRNPAFWEFLNELDNVWYITKPSPWPANSPEALWLPYTPTPKADWAGFRLSQYKAIFMHATVTGAVVENGQVMTNDDFPILPRQAKIYSGDIHVPQQIRNITYVGAPHPIKFGDTYKCRMLLLDRDFDIALEIPLRTQQKLMLTINSVEDLARFDGRLARGDQVKVRFNLSASELTRWGAAEAAIAAWAQNHGITVASTEVLVDSGTWRFEAEQTPEAILRDFAASERLSDDLLQVGLDLLRRAS